MAKDASRVPYIAIVALVVVVAIVVLVLNIRSSSEEAVAGEAISIKTLTTCIFCHEQHLFLVKFIVKK